MRGAGRGSMEIETEGGREKGRKGSGIDFYIKVGDKERKRRRVSKIRRERSRRRVDWDRERKWQ